MLISTSNHNIAKKNLYFCSCIKVYIWRGILVPWDFSYHTSDAETMEQAKQSHLGESLEWLFRFKRYPKLNRMKY